MKRNQTRELTKYESFSEYDEPTQTFYVCFCGDNEYTCSRFFKKGFTHVSVFRQIGEIFLAHDPNRYVLDTWVLEVESTKLFFKYFLQSENKYTILEVVKREPRKERKAIGFGFNSCVYIVQYLLGVKLKRCFTPYQLYKRLMTTKHPEIISVRELSHGIFK